MESTLYYKVILISIFITTGWIGFTYGRQSQEKPIIIQFSTHKINLYNSLSKIGIELSCIQKDQLTREVKNYEKEPIGFK